MAYRIKNGNRPGFTFIELMAVIVIMSLLVTIVVPRYKNSVERAKLSTLRQDLYIMRKKINEYFSDKGFYPNHLSNLQDENYIRAVPVDPVTGKKDWVEIGVDDATYEGVSDIQSFSHQKSIEGISYSDY